MKKRLAALLLILSLPAVAFAMTQSQLPSKFNVPWGNSAGAPYIRTIPQSSQIGIQNCAASLTDGFPPLTFVPQASGGCPPFGQDFNGILAQITKWSQWQSAGGPVFYDSGFSSQIGGYPKGAVLQSSVLAGRLWFSTADNNTTNPDSTSSANWTVLPGTYTAGTPIAALTTAAQPNAVPANGLTVGNASSNATNRANADTYWLFAFLWTNCSGCQLYNSVGGAIARGGSASADFAANDAVATINMNGTGMIGADSQAGTTSSLLAGVPVVSGSRTVPGSILGENFHALTASENGTHTHANSLTDPGHTHGTVLSGSFIAGTSTAVGQSGGAFSVPINPSSFNVTVNAAFTGVSINNASSGAGTGHNTVERNVIVYWNLAL